MLEQIINQFHAFWANKTLSELINQYWNENNDQVYNILKMRLIHFGVSESDQQVFQKQYNAQLKEAAQNDNDPRAQTLIGLSYLYGLQGSCDYEQAFDSFEKAAEQKNPWALEDLGVMYGRGWGVEKNYSHARDFCQKAVYYGNAQANRVLGILYHEGLGVSSDDQLALEYFQLAKNAGEIRAIHHLGDHYYNRQDYQTAKTYFEESVAQGESLSLKVLGDLYKDGLGVSQDFNKALLCYEACAKLYSNHQSTLPDSTNDTYLLLGNLYRYTVGDSVKAKYYYQQAANLNDTEAREELEILNIAIRVGLNYE